MSAQALYEAAGEPIGPQGALVASMSRALMEAYRTAPAGVRAVVDAPFAPDHAPHEMPWSWWMLARELRTVRIEAERIRETKEAERVWRTGTARAIEPREVRK